MSSVESRQRLEESLMRPLTHTDRAWFVWVAVLIALIVAGMVAYIFQLRDGLAVTGMGDTVIWGFYISNFVFFSGVAMAGTFISGVLRMTGAEWRKPLTRFSELTTVAALTMCAIMPAIDMGRPDRLWHILRYGRLESPLVWDVLVIPTYLAASVLYLYLFLIPDSAFLRERFTASTSPKRHRFYSAVALGWKGLPDQRRRLRLSGNLMMVMIIPIAVATHSVVSWIFGLTYRSGWDSTIFAPYFVVGALYSGTAMLITMMYIFRRVYGLEEYLTLRHFKLLATLLVVFGLTYTYFTFAEYLTVSYKLEEADDALLQELFFGRYAVLVWFGFIGGQLIPVTLAALPRTRTLHVLFAASLLANVGMWIKRLIIVVPSLSEPLLPYAWGVYRPTLVETLITLSSFAGFAFVITVFAKFFPIISLSEMTEEADEEQVAVAERPPQAPLAHQPAGGQ